MFLIFPFEIKKILDDYKIELACLLTRPLQDLLETKKKYQKAIKYAKRHNIGCALYYRGKWLDVWVFGKHDLALKEHFNKNIEMENGKEYQILNLK